MKIAIIDDTLLDSELLKKYINLYLPEQFTRDIQSFSDSDEFVVNYKCGSFDLIFLDIYMPGKSGIETAECIRNIDKDVKIVFCTSSNEFASESYVLGASFYLCKPFTKERFIQMLTHVFPKREDAIQITLPDTQRIIPRNIIYTTYFNHKITIYIDNSKPIETWLSQSSFEQLLVDFPYLCTCNRGNIVNFHYVKEYDNANFILTNGEAIAVSRRTEKAVLAAYSDFTFNKNKKL